MENQCFKQLTYYLFPILKWRRCLKSILLERKDPVMFRQYHGCWWTGEGMSQGIGNEGINQKCPGFNTGFICVESKSICSRTELRIALRVSVHSTAADFWPVHWNRKITPGCYWHVITKKVNIIQTDMQNIPKWIGLFADKVSVFNLHCLACHIHWNGIQLFLSNRLVIMIFYLYITWNDFIDLLCMITLYELCFMIYLLCQKMTK